MKKTSKKITLLRVLSYIKRYLPFIAISLLLAVITVAFTLYIPIVVGEAIDKMVGTGAVKFDIIFPLLTKITVIATAGAVLQWLMSIINNLVTYNVVRDMRRDAFRKLQFLPVGYIDSHPHGDILSRVINDSEQFSDGLLMGFTQLFTGIVTIVGTLIFMIRINCGIALVVVVLTPMSLLLARFIAKRSHSLFVKKAEATGETTAYINEMIGNQKVTIAFSNEQDAIDNFDVINKNLEKTSLGAIFYSSLVNPSTRFLNSVIYAFVGLCGAFFTIAGKMTIGGLSCFLSYAGQYAKPFNEISGVVTELQNSFACAQRLFDLIDEKTEDADDVADESITIDNVIGNVVFEHVYFSYVPERKLITDITLNVKAGQRVAIVGPTGCGKTTLINLLMRFYDVTAGRITLDGTDIRKIRRDSLRSKFGMVLQETWLANDTVRNNIAVGKPDVTDEEIESAAKSAHAHDFIMRLKNGYDTVVGEAGENLSQGEKQLLCIARIMIMSPPMLILDEATSSIDTRTELKIQDAFSKLMEGRTSFIVAHRLSTIREADIILVMKDGNIIEQGSHGQLLAQNGFYSVLYNSQFAGKES